MKIRKGLKSTNLEQGSTDRNQSDINLDRTNKNWNSVQTKRFEYLWYRRYVLRYRLEIDLTTPDSTLERK